MNTFLTGSVPSPGKNLFLQLSAKAVRGVNREHDGAGLAFASKATIERGMAKQSNGIWEIQQLFPHIKSITRTW